MVTIERPSFEIERIPSVFGMPISAVSMGKVTSCSTSRWRHGRALGDDHDLIVRQVRKRVDRDLERHIRCDADEEEQKKENEPAIVE